VQAEIIPTTIVIFGASGDLTRRKLVPALHSLACEGLARADDIELSWKLIDPLTEVGSPSPYEVGSWGPTEAVEGFLGAGRQWYQGCCGADREIGAENAR